MEALLTSSIPNLYGLCECECEWVGCGAEFYECARKEGNEDAIMAFLFFVVVQKESNREIGCVPET